jgi:4a-hydroxytetrahydrobiopterin dehydratase
MEDPQRITEAGLADALSDLPGWTGDSAAIEKSFAFTDFNAAFRFLSGVALLAERADHHPEIWNVYNRVRLRLTTHDAGGLTGKDTALAAEIEGLL